MVRSTTMVFALLLSTAPAAAFDGALTPGLTVSTAAVSSDALRSTTLGIAKRNKYGRGKDRAERAYRRFCRKHEPRLCADLKKLRKWVDSKVVLRIDLF